MILAAAASAYLLVFPASQVQIGVAIGTGSDQRLIALVPKTGCHDGMTLYYSRYGDIPKALAVIEKSRICAMVDKRIVERPAIIEAMRAASYKAGPQSKESR